MKISADDVGKEREEERKHEEEKLRYEEQKQSLKEAKCLSFAMVNKSL